MTRLRFGAFLAPHHPLGEHPTLQLRNDLDLAEHLDRLGFDEFWCGEHHSTGWEMIASPELFLAAAGERTHRIGLGTGVISLPYHHPFMVAQRMVQLDHLTRGRALFGSGPGALPSDAAVLQLDPMRQRDMQDEALGVIIDLLRGETVTYETDWFRMRDATLQILPLQPALPMAVASSISPSGMRLAGKYGIGVLSLASTSTEGLLALPTQWGFAEESAREHGSSVHRADWRVLMSWHLATSRDRARDEAVDGLQHWNNDYNVKVLGRPDAQHVDDKWELIEQVAGQGASGAGAAVIGTPDDMIEAAQKMLELTGGFGTLLGFAHDWADREATRRSWELFARYVMPELQGLLDAQRRSAAVVAAHQGELMAQAGAAIVDQINRTASAREALAITIQNASKVAAGSSAAAGSAIEAAKEQQR